MSGFRRVGDVATMLSIVILVAGACGGPAPSGPASSASTAPPPSGSAQSSGSPAPGTIIGFNDSDDPSAASRQELALVHALRDDAGMPALLGPSGPAAFTTLDATEAAFGFKSLQEAATAAQVSTGGRGLAAVGRTGDAAPLPLADVDISIFADSGFTASAIMSLYSDLVGNADRTDSTSLPRTDTRDEGPDAAGNRQHVVLTMTMSVRTGGGKVAGDIIMSAKDTITDANGHVTGVYTSSANGHIDAEACPDVNGIAKGNYSFATSHVLDGTGQAPAKADRGVSAPFKLIDDETASLVSIDADMTLAADASGPGTASGPGPTGPFDWQATQHLPISIPAHGGGSFNLNGFAPTVTGTGGQSATGTLLVSAGLAQLFLGEVAKRAEDFWRSGKCIELKPSDDTRKVKPNERIDLTVEATQAFDHQKIEKPMVATFTGTKSLDPAGTPVGPPAKFTFTAGPNKDDKGTIDLKQTSKRGIGKRQIVFTVDDATFKASIEAKIHQDAGGNVYDTAIHLKPTDLTPGQGGSSSATATVTWTTTYRAPGGACKPKTYEGTFQTEVTVQPDPADPTRVLLKASFIPGVLKQEALVCQGHTYPFTGSTSLGVWAFLSTEHAATIGGHADVDIPTPFGTAKATITVTKK